MNQGSMNKAVPIGTRVARGAAVVGAALLLLAGCQPAAPVVEPAAGCTARKELCVALEQARLAMVEINRYNISVAACSFTKDPTRAACTVPQPKPNLPRDQVLALEQAVAIFNWQFRLDPAHEAYGPGGAASAPPAGNAPN